MKRKFKYLLVIVATLLLPLTVNAKVLEYDNTIKIKGEQDSTKMVFGNIVNNEATIDGLSMMFGNQVNGAGKLLYGGYAGNIVNIEDEIEKDLFVAGNMITIGEDAKINRDVFIAGNMVNISANVKRHLNIAASEVTLDDITIGGDAHIYAERINFSENTKIVGTLTVSEDTELIGLTDKMYGKIVKEEVKATVKIDFRTRIVDVLISLIMTYVSAIVILSVFKKLKSSLGKVNVTVKDVAKTSLKGLCALIVVPVISIIAMVTVALVPVSIITLLIYGISIYLSFLFASYVIGHAIWTIKKSENLFIELLIGVIITKILAIIPILGGLVSAVVLFYGFGIIYNLIRGLIKEEN